MRKIIRPAIFIVFFLLVSTLSYAATISLSLGNYDNEIYKQSSVNIPVTVTASNISGNVNVVFTPKNGLGCDSCSKSATFTGGTNEQKTVTFTLTGTKTGNYNPPFLTIAASSGSTEATPLSSGDNVVVIEKPTWEKDFSASSEDIDIDDTVTLTLDITSFGGSFEDVEAELSLGDWDLLSGNNPKDIGTVSGSSSYSWVVKATSAGTKDIDVSLTASNPKESASSNTESVSITVTDPDAGNDDPDEDSNSPGGSSGGGAGGGSGEIENFGLLNGTGTMTITNPKYSFTELTVNVNQPIQNAKLFVEKKSYLDENLYPSIGGTVYQYTKISSPTIGDNAFEGGTIKFKVNKTWLSDNDLDAGRMFLLRFNNNNWVQEATVRTGSDTDFVYYAASYDAFGMFAVSSLDEVELDYLSFSSLIPQLIDLEMVIESGLSDSLMITKIEGYYNSRLDIKKTIEQSQEFVKGLEIKREVKNNGEISIMTFTIKNNMNESVTFMSVEAVPKTIVYDIYELYDFNPRVYDLIIREDPVIQWSFGKADTAIVAWEIKDLGPEETASFSYSLDAIFDLNTYPAPIIVKPYFSLSNVEAAEDGVGVENANVSDISSNMKLLGLLGMLVLFSVISIAVSRFSKKKESDEEAKNDNETRTEASKEVHPKHNAHSKITDFIEKQKAKGVSDEAIKAKLVKVGWSEEKIEKAFKRS